MQKLWIIFIFCYLTAYSQSEPVPLQFQNITIEQGLPHNFVHSITQDKRGFIWIGTNYGLARYDGYNFKVFQPNPKKQNSITHKSIGSIFADSRGYLWLSINSGGINRLDLKTEQFKSYFLDSVNIKYPSGISVRFFFEDNDNNLWLATNSGIFSYNYKQDKFRDTSAKGKNETANTYITDMADDGMGNIWFLVENKIGVLSKKTFKIVSIGEFASNINLDSIKFTTVFSKDKGIVWLTTERNGLIAYKIKSNRFERYLENVIDLCDFLIDRKGNQYVLSNKPTYRLFARKKEKQGNGLFELYPLFDSDKPNPWINIIDDNFGNIWICSPVGLGKFNFNSGVTIYKSSNLVANTITDNNIENIFIDRTDNLWICPYRKGLNKADLRQKPFKLITPEITSLTELATKKNISSVYEDSKGYIWTGNSDKGIRIYDKKSAKFYTFTLNHTETVTSIYEDNHGNMWLGTIGDLYKVKYPQIKNLDPNRELTFSNIVRYNVMGVKKIVEDQSNNLWFATSNGLIELDRLKNKLINHTSFFDNVNSNSGFYRTLIIDKDQIIWIGSNNKGLGRYEKSKKKFKYYQHDPKNIKSISNNTVYAIYQDKDNCLWIGTGQGLDKYNPKTEEFEHADISNELFMKSIFSILPDTMGNLWMSTDFGIIRYNIKTKKSSLFGQADGIENGEFSTTANYMSNSGEIFFGCMEGLVSFYPCKIKQNPVYSKPLINNFLLQNKIVSPGDTINGRVLLNKQIWETNEVTLFYYETDFTIEFSALHFSAPEKIEYQYKLDGFNSDWIKTGSKKRYASYTGLPPGKYTFRLKATNNDRLMCLPQDEVRFSINIVPPFWKTNWFRVALFILALASIAFLYKLRTSQFKRQKNILAKKVKERTFDLENLNTELEERQEEILQQNEEIKLQREVVIEQHARLEEAYKELSLYETKLEKIVEERTKELVIAKLKAEESDKLKSSFLANLSHEIRTPLNAIIGFSDLLIDGNPENPSGEVFKSMIQRSADSLLNLINDILDFSKIEAGAISVNNTVFRISKILDDVREIFQTEQSKLKASTNSNLEFRIVAAEELMEQVIFTDENRLKQILQNLISNAVKFTSEGYVELGVEITSDHENLKFYVKDTGIGISKANQVLIFGRFRKIENPSSNIFRGTGIGLSICKHLCKFLGGHITVDSELGSGSTFHFTIPFLQQNKNIVTKNEQKLPSHPPEFKGKTILLIDDDDSNYLLTKIYIKKTKASLVRALNLIEAEAILKENILIDMVLIDMDMHKMNGFEAMYQIRNTKPQIHIVAQTAYSYQEEIDKIIGEGFNDYLVKPINAKKLFLMLQKYL